MIDMWRKVLFVLGLLPLLAGLWIVSVAGLGVDPAKVAVDYMAHCALSCLLLTLCMSPLRHFTGWTGWIALRRQVGLWCFFYAGLHLLAFVALILGWRGDRLLHEMVERPYVLVGMLAFVGLLLLALTSNRFSQRRLGGRWKRLHRSIYLITLLVLLHYLWVVRSDWLLWGVYALAAILLLGWRLPWRTAIEKTIDRA